VLTSRTANRGSIKLIKTAICGQKWAPWICVGGMTNVWSSVGFWNPITSG
jgi:hypothetical protein